MNNNEMILLDIFQDKTRKIELESILKHINNEQLTDINILINRLKDCIDSLDESIRENELRLY